MKFNENYTEFLSPERASHEEVLESFRSLDSQIFVKAFLDAAPGIILILNKHRQIVHASSTLFDVINEKNRDSILGFKPGEIFNCVNAHSSPGGCGTAKACSVCGVGRAIQQSINNVAKTVAECRILTKNNNTTDTLELRVTASPLVLNNTNYFILSLFDISNEKRRNLLENVFLQDVVSIAGGLKNIIEKMKVFDNNNPDSELLRMADSSATNLLEEIESQRLLLAAETGDLEVDFREVNTADILQGFSNILSKSEIAANKTISVSDMSENISLVTDRMILRRVLINLTVNALEASKEGDTVTIECKRENNEIAFSVNNKSVIPEAIMFQIFQRSFTTKKRNKGIGTYSIKLYTEKYLKGSVSFISNEETGTTFFVKFPYNQKLF